ncbi:hypothetical protein ACLB0R_12700 [Sphingomonas sp. GlSt437]|uniref:hypothetical protein n=1 Tax=Sphingomonas sp. GlSt437 TaxID=3389970 RepID=UPI003A839771
MPALAQQTPTPPPPTITNPPTIANPPTIVSTKAPGAPTIATMPATADTGHHEAPVNGILYIYGNERCPTDTNGNEIVVCVRRSADERFRLPKDLRQGTIKPEYQAWAQRQQGTLAAGAGGIGSCSTVGVGGATGCQLEQLRAAKADRQAQKAEEKAAQDYAHPN